MPHEFRSTLIGSFRSDRRKPRIMASDDQLGNLPDDPTQPQEFKIKAAETDRRRNLVSRLLDERYSWRGYRSVELAVRQSKERFTLVALSAEQPLGTITVVFDRGRTLAADGAFREELDAMRAQRQLLCEFTKLAIDPKLGSKRVLAGLFHVAYIVAHRLRRFDRLVIEVNPRHRRYYERALDLEVVGPERLNRSVNAPAVLLSASFDHIRERIERHGGAEEETERERSLYPLFFNQTQEEDILLRLTHQVPRAATPID
jgi:hypothetical protein